MSNKEVTSGKQIKVSNALHSRIYAIAESQRKETGRPHPAYVVVDDAISLLEKKVGK